MSHSPQSQFTVQSNSCSKMNFPSLYFSVCSYARSYFQPTVSLHCLQQISRTTCLPVVILRSPASPERMLTTLLKRYALPCWPRKFWLAALSVHFASTRRRCGKHAGEAYTADDLIMVREMRLAFLAAVDLLRVEVGVVCETHPDCCPRLPGLLCCLFNGPLGPLRLALISTQSIVRSCSVVEFRFAVRSYSSSWRSEGM